MTTFLLHPSSDPLPAQAGGKARALDRLAAAGFAPPPFFVILPGAFADNGLRPQAAEAIATALQDLGDGPFAVRSSGAQEDGSDHSHAGQFLTELNVPFDRVAPAAVAVWQSGAEAHVAGYQSLRGIPVSDRRPAVIVQTMVPASASGVAFSADPVSGLRHHIVISAINGLGDRLVAGEEDGETWTVDRLQSAVIAAPDTADALAPDHVLALADLAIQVEEAFGGPQDIEWAIADGRLHILQARPITTTLKSPATPDNALHIFDNSNIIESYPGLVTPLTYSFAKYAYNRVYRAFLRMVGVSPAVINANAAVFENMLARIDGRVTYNLVNWYRALALLPGFAINRSHMETMMGVSEPLPERVTAQIGQPALSTLGRLREYGRMAQAGGGLIWQAIRLNRTISAFETRLNQAIGPESLPLESSNLTALAAEYRRIEASLLDRWDAPIINDFLCMMAFGGSRKLMESWFGQPGLAVHNHIMIGQGDIISAEPAKRIAQMGTMVAAIEGLADRLPSEGTAALAPHPALRSAFDAYIHLFGERCTEELKLESIPLDEDPSALLAAIRAASLRPPMETSTSDEATPDFQTLTKGKPVKGFLAKRLVGWAKKRVRDRENLRFERTRIFGRARKLFLAMGREFTNLGHLTEPRDVLYLTVDELLGAVEGSIPTQDLGSLVHLRRAADQAAAQRPELPERFTVSGAAVNARRLGQSQGQHAPVAPQALTQTGVPCSAGRITAKARVIANPARESLDHGDILVARHTDPGWIAVFANASAIVVERGSLLSHSAIVAREMGIPCVVALKGATRWIVDGEMITVDGATGLVTRQGE